MLLEKKKSRVDRVTFQETTTGSISATSRCADTDLDLFIVLISSYQPSCAKARRTIEISRSGRDRKGRIYRIYPATFCSRNSAGRHNNVADVTDPLSFVRAIACKNIIAYRDTEYRNNFVSRSRGGARRCSRHAWKIVRSRDYGKRDKPR